MIKNKPCNTVFPCHPVAFSIGIIKIYWYPLAYIAGILLGTYQIKKAMMTYELDLHTSTIDALNTWIIIGIMVGGRLGFVLFYDLPYYLTHPLAIIQTWKGGMSFHGGFIGVALALLLFCRYHVVNFWKLADLLAIAAPLGLFFGRIANFINGELCGRPTTLPWGVVFPEGGAIPRHPSQLYEAFFEGFVCWIALGYIYKHQHHKPGRTTGWFLVLYGIFRFALEFLREPEVWLAGLTLGQALCIPMIGGGMLLLAKQSRLVLR